MKKYNYQKVNCQLSNVNCRNSGFTLIEMLVVLTIVSFLAIGFFKHFKVNNQSMNNLAGQEIVFYLKDVKQMVLNNDLDGINRDVDCKSGKCLLGISFDIAGYNIFIDRNNPPNYYFDSEDLVLKNIILPDKLKYISEMSSIIFEPPYGDAHILNSSHKIVDCSLWCEIKIIDKNKKEIIVKINNQGLPYVE